MGMVEMTETVLVVEPPQKDRHAARDPNTGRRWGYGRLVVSGRPAPASGSARRSRQESGEMLPAISSACSTRARSAGEAGWTVPRPAASRGRPAHAERRSDEE